MKMKSQENLKRLIFASMSIFIFVSCAQEPDSNLIDLDKVVQNEPEEEVEENLKDETVVINADLVNGLWTLSTLTMSQSNQEIVEPAKLSIPQERLIFIHDLQYNIINGDIATKNIWTELSFTSAHPDYFQQQVKICIQQTPFELVSKIPVELENIPFDSKYEVIVLHQNDSCTEVTEATVKLFSSNYPNHSWIENINIDLAEFLITGTFESVIEVKSYNDENPINDGDDFETNLVIEFK